MVNDFLHVVSVSGGKDSTVTYLWAMDKFGKDGFKAVMADTGHEHPVTLNYVRNLHEMTGGPQVEIVKADFSERIKRKLTDPSLTKSEAVKAVIERNREHLEKNNYTSGNQFLDMMIWKGRVPSTKNQFCTEFTKLHPIREWLIKNRGDLPVIMYVGIRRGESVRRSQMPREELNEFMDCMTVRPIIEWSEEQVFEFLKEKGVPPNPLYEAGYSRVGCFPCIHARKSELGTLPEWAWEKLEEWESKLGISWFHPSHLPNNKERRIPTIDEIRAWSKTKHGGKEINPEIDEKDVPSCMSTWGACE